MKKRRVVLSEAALADIRLITAWLTREASRDVARRYARKMRQKLEGLSYASERGTLRGDIASNLRVIGILGAVTVAFRVRDGDVEIARISYGGQDWQTALADKDDED